MSHPALAALLAVQPRLAAVRTAGQALGLGPRELLHAGPPLADPTRPPPVLAAAVAVTAVHEGWASTLDEADALLASGALRLSPAQPRSCVTPLALPVSACTPLLGVDDGARPGERLWAPVSAVRGTDTRMGRRDLAVCERLRDRDQAVAPGLADVLQAHGPLPLLPLAAAGLSAGDDLHSRTSAANAALAWVLRDRGADGLAADVEATPLFFLTPWMAACALVLRAAEGGDCPALVTRGGGNGECFGIALAGSPARWITVPAGAPQGPRLPTASAGAAVAGAIGDSAVIDLLGLGGQRLGLAPEPRALVAPWLGSEERPQAWLQAPHPGLGCWPVGLDVRCVARAGAHPRVMLAMLAADGQAGLLGRGVWQPPAALWSQAAALAGG